MPGTHAKQAVTQALKTLTAHSPGMLGGTAERVDEAVGGQEAEADHKRATNSRINGSRTDPGHMKQGHMSQGNKTCLGPLAC